MIKKRQFFGVAFDGVIHQKAQRIDQSSTRGIIFNRPERFLVNTPFGQLEIAWGDWLVEMPTGEHYIIKDSDIEAFGYKRANLVQRIKNWIRSIL